MMAAVRNFSFVFGLEKIINYRLYTVKLSRVIEHKYDYMTRITSCLRSVGTKMANMGRGRLGPTKFAYKI
jgi:hypothetical protein